MPGSARTDMTFESHPVTPPDPAYGASSAGRLAALRKQSTQWLVVALATFFLFGCGNCFGLIGAILCFLAMQAVDQNHLEDAEAKLRWGKIITLAGLALAVLTAILLGLYFAWTAAMVAV